MLRFKQYLLIEQNIPEFVPVDPQSNSQKKDAENNTGIKHGTYKISAMDVLSNRLGSTQKALDYLESIKQRRAQHSSEIDQDWYLPSLELDDYSEKIDVALEPRRPTDPLGITPSTVKIDKKTNNIVDYKKQNPQIVVNTNARSPYPEGMEGIKKDLTKVSNELQPNGKYKKDTGALSDVLWHEFQHALALKTFKTKNRPASSLDAKGYDYSDKDPIIPSEMSKYVTSPGELAAHMSENKMRFFEKTGILLDPNFRDEDFEKYKNFLETDKSKQSSILLQLFKDPKKGEQAKEFLKQIAQTNKRDTGEMMA
jgi:hypothetical protein